MSKRKSDFSGVYKIENTINGKCYIGVSKHCMARWMQHKRTLRRGVHHNKHLQRAWNQYGQDAFQFSIIEKCSFEQLREREIFWIKFYNSCDDGYNMSYGGDGAAGVVFSTERNKAIGDKLRGQKRPQYAGALSYNARKVVCLNTQQVFDCIVDAAKELDISDSRICMSCCDHRTVTSKMLIFAYYEDYIKMAPEEVSQLISEQQFKRKHTGDAAQVICLTTGEVFRYIGDACEKYHTDKSWLHKCCKGYEASAGKLADGTRLTWMFLSDYENASNEEIERRRNLPPFVKAGKVPVRCVTTGEYFDTLKAAIEKYNIPRTTFSRYLKKGHFTLGSDPITGQSLEWEKVVA